MKINITTKNFELTPSIREYIETKMNYLDHFIEDWISAGSVELDFDAGRDTNHHNKGQVYYAEANLKVPGTMIRVKKSAENLRAAVDVVKDVLAEEVKKYKEKGR
jgi:putative sigma-54 modulation protein